MARTTKIQKKSSKAAPKKISAPSSPKSQKTDGGDFQQVRTLIDLLKKNGLAVLEFEQGDLRVTLKTPAGAGSGATLIQGHAPVTPSPVSQPSVEKTTSPEPTKSNFKEITSPMVGHLLPHPITRRRAVCGSRKNHQSRNGCLYRGSNEGDERDQGRDFWKGVGNRCRKRQAGSVRAGPLPGQLTYPDNGSPNPCSRKSL